MVSSNIDHLIVRLIWLNNATITDAAIHQKLAPINESRISFLSNGVRLCKKSQIRKIPSPRKNPTLEKFKSFFFKKLSQFVIVIGKNNDRFEFFGFFKIHGSIRNDNYFIIYCYFSRSGTIQRNNP